MYENIRPAPRWLLGLVLAAVVLMIVLATWVVPRTFWLSLHQPTYGLINLAYLAYFLVVVCGVLLGIGRRRPTEIGLEWQKLRIAAVYTCLVWSGLQMVMAAWYWAAQRPIDIANEWAGDGPLHNVGTFIGHFFGNALNEEVVFRGFYLVQFVLLFRSRWPHRPRLAFALALILISAFFSAMHVPDRLMRHKYTSPGAVVGDQIELFVPACVYSWIYWRTGNLFFAVGLHGLSNLPTTLLAWHNLGPLQQPGPVVLILGIALAEAWRGGIHAAKLGST